MPVAVAVPELDQGWIRAVLFEHAIDDWLDLGPDPLRRRYVGDTYAQQVSATYQSWKWLTDRAGTDVNDPPPVTEMPELFAAAVAASDWTELVAVLMTLGRAQALLFGDLARSGGDTARRAFDRPARDCAGQAALAYLELRTGVFVDTTRAGELLAGLIPTTRRWLESVDAARPGADPLTHRWLGAIRPLLRSLNLPVE